MAREKLKPELPTKRDENVAEAQKAREQAANPENRPAQPGDQQVMKTQVTNAERKALDEDGNPIPGPHSTKSGRHTFPGLDMPQRSRELHLTPISRSTPKHGEVRESDALIELAYWYKADGPAVTLVEPTDRSDADQFRLEARTRQGFRDDLVLTIRKGRQAHTEIDLNSSYRVEVVEMEDGEVLNRFELWLLGTTKQMVQRIGGLFAHLRGAKRDATALSRITYTNVPRHISLKGPSHEARPSTRDATTNIQQEESMDAPVWTVHLPRSGQTWTFGGFFGRNKDKIERLESEWYADASADAPTEYDNEPSDASDQETSQHEDKISPQGAGSSPPPGPIATPPQDADHTPQ